MDDSIHDSLRQTADSHSTGLELPTAARVLRISPDALRKRIERGKVQAYKEDGRWLVVLDNSDIQTRQARTERTDKSSAELYERIITLTAESTRYKTLAEVSESTLRETEEHYKATIAELQHERTILEQRVAELQQVAEPEQELPRRRWWGGKR